MSTPSIAMPITCASALYLRSIAKSSRPVSARRDPDKGCELCVTPGRLRFRYCCNSASIHPDWRDYIVHGVGVKRASGRSSVGRVDGALILDRACCVQTSCAPLAVAGWPCELEHGSGVGPRVRGERGGYRPAARGVAIKKGRHMCVDNESRPPIFPIAGGSAGSRDLRLTSADGTRFGAHAARASTPTGAGMVVIPDVH